VVRGADAVLLVADLSADSALEDLEAVLRAFELRKVRFARERGAAEGEEGAERVRARIVANKLDAPGAVERLELLRGWAGPGLEVLPVSSATGNGLAARPAELFGWLRIVRVYTKHPGEKADLSRPYTLFSGQTVAELCGRVHKDFAERLAFARLWRGSVGPLTVSRDQPLQDRDVLELHLRTGAG
jgi:hypothetical protein